VALNFYDRNGHFVDHRLVEEHASAARISLRTGCFCNPGDGESALGLSADQLRSCFAAHTERLTLDEYRRCMYSESTGAVRVSLGLATTFADVYRFVSFARTFLGWSIAESGGGPGEQPPPPGRASCLGDIAGISPAAPVSRL
jgi:selenocysteine lyase/cysteine desulfurase